MRRAAPSAHCLRGVNVIPSDDHVWSKAWPARAVHVVGGWTQDCNGSTMEWKPGGVSDDVEDRRSGGGGGFGGYGPHFGVGGTLLLLVLSLVFHRNLFLLFS